MLIVIALIVSFYLNREETEMLPPVEVPGYKVKLSPEGNLDEVKTATIRKSLGTSEMLYGKFPPIVFQLINLEELDFSRTEISDLTPIQHLKQLKQIISRENELSGLRGIENFPNLVSLDISFNNLNLSELRGIENSPNLVSLDISDNNLSELRGIENFPNLVSLDISENNLSDLRGIENLKNLESLDLDGNSGLTNLSGIEILQKLQSLDLSGLSKLSDLRGIEYLKNLKELSIGHNSKFESFPPEILHLGNLNKLSLRFLEFRSFPDSFYTSGMPIEILQMSFMCNFDYRSNLPRFHKLEKLRELYLEDHLVNDIPVSNINFAKCENLEEFSYTYSKKIDIAGAMKKISQAPKLKRLILRDNRNMRDNMVGISYLPKEIALCDSLESLILSNNNIKKLPQAITKLKNLKLIDLRRNPIDTIAIKEIEKEMVNTTFYYDK